jgi:23S rRNA (adenine2503-C2)-methyltransferase
MAIEQEPRQGGAGRRAGQLGQTGRHAGRTGRAGQSEAAGGEASGMDGAGAGGERRAAWRPPQHLADLEPTERGPWAEQLGLPRMRAHQVAHHYFKRLENQPAAMTDLPAGSREQIAQQLAPELIEELGAHQTDSGATLKTLYRLNDGALVESVLMAYPDRATLCVSSQVGCGMACPFCATGKMGLTRNLSAGEMLEQIRLGMEAINEGRCRWNRGDQAASAAGEEPAARLSGVVFMGMGEPLANYKALLRTLRGITEFGLSARHVTVSTCGLIGAIDRLAGEGIPVRLAVSLHSAADQVRNRLVPINKRWGVEATLAAAHQYYLASGRRVSIEYALIRDINDQPWQAALLARRLCQYGTRWVHVNPIPLNPVPGSIWTASRPKVQAEFIDRLTAAGLTVTLRDTRGKEIDGACGQLAAKEGMKR